MIESLLSVLTWIENTGKYHKSSSHFFIDRFLPYIHSSETLLDSEGKKTQTKTPAKQNLEETNKATAPNPLETAAKKPDTKLLCGDIVSVLRVRSLVRGVYSKKGLAIYWGVVTRLPAVHVYCALLLQLVLPSGRVQWLFQCSWL